MSRYRLVELVLNNLIVLAFALLFAFLGSVYGRNVLWITLVVVAFLALSMSWLVTKSKFGTGFRAWRLEMTKKPILEETKKVQEAVDLEASRRAWNEGVR